MGMTHKRLIMQSVCKSRNMGQQIVRTDPILARVVPFESCWAEDSFPGSSEDWK